MKTESKGGSFGLGKKLVGGVCGVISVGQFDVAGFLDDSGTKVLVAVNDEKVVQVLEEGEGTALKWK